jgi:hypothetical protein
VHRQLSNCSLYYKIQAFTDSFVSVSDVMIYQDLKESLETERAKGVLAYLGLNITSEEKAQQIGLKIWEFYLQNNSLSYGTNLIKLAEV